MNFSKSNFLKYSLPRGLVKGIRPIAMSFLKPDTE